jgi:hypothetical protein
VAPIGFEWPKGSVALNAVPWAEVWIDGEKLGETPIGNLSLPIGPHEAVFATPSSVSSVTRCPSRSKRRRAVSIRGRNHEPFYSS